MRLSCSRCSSENLLLARLCRGCSHRLWKDRAVDALLIAAFVVCVIAYRKIGTPPPR